MVKLHKKQRHKLLSWVVSANVNLGALIYCQTQPYYTKRSNVQVQGVQFLATFSRRLLEGLIFHNYWWPMTHFLPRHGRFMYLTETLMLSPYYGQQGHSEWEVKIEYIGNIPPFSFKLIPSIQIAWLPGVIKPSSRTVLETF